MSIRMRVNKSDDCTCKVCGATRDSSLELFDIAFTDKHIITICDVCNNILFNKTLKASCSLNAKVKSQNDLEVIRSRNTIKSSIPEKKRKKQRKDKE